MPKYREGKRQHTFWLDERIAKRLEQLAEVSGMSKTQIVAKLIMTANPSTWANMKR